MTRRQRIALGFGAVVLCTAFFQTTMQITKMIIAGSPWYDVTAAGARGDGLHDDGPAFNLAFSRSSNVLVPYSASGYKLVTTVNMPAGATLDCQGSTLFHSSNSTTLLSTSGDDGTLRNCHLQGSNGGIVGAQTAEILLYILGGHRWRFNNITAENSDGWGIKRDIGTDSASGVHGDRGQMTNVVAKNSFVGMQFIAGTSAEYMTVSNFAAVSNRVGLLIAAGNIIVSNCNITDNNTGVWVTAGPNSAHGIVSNCNVNHNGGVADDNVFADTVTNGFTFSNNHIYANDAVSGFIHLKASNGILFVGNFIDSNINNDAANGSNNFFLSNYMVSNVATLAPAGSSGLTNLVNAGNTIPTGFGWWAWNNSFNVAFGIISAGTPPAAGATVGDLAASRSATTGGIFLGSDGANSIFRNGNAFQLHGFTSIVPASASLSSLGTTALPFSNAVFSGNVVAPAGVCYNAAGTVCDTAGAGAPAGACTTGSTYRNTTGGALTTFYVCEAAAWVAK